jgi:uncharacterized protein (DUF885 family)
MARGSDGCAPSDDDRSRSLGAMTVRELADEVFAYRLENDALLRVRQGLPVEHLRSESDDAWIEDAAFAGRILAQLRATRAQDEDERLTAGFLEHLLGIWRARAQHLDLGFTVTPYSSYLLSVGLQHTFRGFAGSAEAYLGLVADHRDQVVQMGVRLRRQREAGVLVPRPAIPGVLESLRGHRQSAGSLLVASAPEAVRERVQTVVDAEVMGAYDSLIGEIDEQYVRDAPIGVGYAQWPGGEDYYRALVREHTASDRSPEQLHQLGLEQVASLATEMAKVRADMGFAGTEHDFHVELANHPALRPKTPEEVEAVFLRHMAALEPLLGQWFSRLPEAPYGVERLDASLEAGMTYGYYEPPTPAVPQGRYRWNGANLEAKSMLTYATLIFHELAPGHHFHVARQRENTSLPDVRRESTDLGAFNEGWAEYAAGLGWEMGLYDDPLDRYGRLVHERFTAQRLVVDTGMNFLGWPLEQGTEFMRANSTDSDGQIASEVLRYSTDLPAQALAYRAGYLEFTRIRRNAEQALGERFDIRDFHEQLLGPGALPFPLIDGHIDHWISRTRPRPTDR